VIGPTLKRELFGAGSALGQHVRIGGRRFLVIGVMAAKGRMLGFDVDDFAYIPVASAQSLFRTEDLMEIDLLFSPGARPEVIKERVRRVLLDRHGGHEDFTVTTQTEMLDSLDRILDVVTLAVAGIGAVSLLVGAVGILTIMWISVGERSAEIGLSKALGATRRQILRLFLIESALLAGAGGVLGVLAGLGLGVLGSWVVPLLEFRSSPLHVLLAFGLSVLVGIASGVLPARRAAALDPIEALHAE
jgi:putative ABC transport system permease protein